MQLNKISKLFVTELNGVDNDDQTTNHHTTQHGEEEDSYQIRYFNQTSSRFGQRSISTASLLSKKKSTQAIESYKNASKKLRLFLKDHEENQVQINTKPLHKTLDNMKRINIITPKASFTHGFSQIRDMKGYLNQDVLLPQTSESKSNQQSIKIQLNKSSQQFTFPISQNNVSDGFMANQDQEYKIIQQINMSKFCSTITPGLEEELINGKQKYNELMQDIREKTKKLQELKRGNINLEQNEIHLSQQLLQNISQIQKEIDEVNEQIYEQERLKESLNYMKQTRQKDRLINSKPLLLHLEIIQHMSRFLSKTTEQLYDDSKKISQLFMEMIEAAHEKKRQESVQKEQWKNSQIRIQKEEEAERLAEFESTMRQIVKNNQKEQKKERAEALKQKKIQEKLQKNALTFQLQEQIDQFNNDFIGFHEGHSVISSYKDLLDFCVHVKQNTKDLKQEEAEYLQINDKLQDEVEELKNELQQLKYSQQTKTDQLIIQHNFERCHSEFKREDDILNIPEFEKENIDKLRKQYFMTNKIYSFETFQQKINKIIKEENHAEILLNGLHTKLQAEVKKMPTAHRQRIPCKKLDYQDLQEQINNLTETIINLQDLITDISNGQLKSIVLNKQPSIQDDQIQDSYMMNISKSFSNQTPIQQEKDNKFDFIIDGQSIVNTTSKPFISINENQKK